MRGWLCVALLFTLGDASFQSGKLRRGGSMPAKPAGQEELDSEMEPDGLKHATLRANSLPNVLAPGSGLQGATSAKLPRANSAPNVLTAGSRSSRSLIPHSQNPASSRDPNAEATTSELRKWAAVTRSFKSPTHGTSNEPGEEEPMPKQDRHALVSALSNQLQASGESSAVFDESPRAVLGARRAKAEPRVLSRPVFAEPEEKESPADRKKREHQEVVDKKKAWMRARKKGRLSKDSSDDADIDLDGRQLPAVEQNVPELKVSHENPFSKLETLYSPVNYFVERKYPAVAELFPTEDVNENEPASVESVLDQVQIKQLKTVERLIRVGLISLIVTWAIYFAANHNF